MLKRAASTGFPRLHGGHGVSVTRAVIEWAAAITAHNLLLRGGEVGVIDGEEIDPERDLTLGAIEFKEPAEVSQWLPWLIAWLVPIKDTLGKDNVAKNAKGQQMLRTKAVSYTLLDQFMTESRFSGDRCRSFSNP